MGFQVRLTKDDPRFYNPSRDVAHNFGSVMHTVAARFDAGAWPGMQAMLRKEGVLPKDVGESLEAVCKFVMSATDVEKEDMIAALDRCGFTQKPVGAQVAVCAMIGSVLLGYYWAGVREATVGGEGPTLGYKDLAARGEEAARYIGMPSWLRRVFKWRDRLATAWRALWRK